MIKKIQDPEEFWETHELASRLIDRLGNIQNYYPSPEWVYIIRDIEQLLDSMDDYLDYPKGNQEVS